jgi:hypothetical protein
VLLRSPYVGEVLLNVERRRKQSCYRDVCNEGLEAHRNPDKMGVSLLVCLGHDTNKYCTQQWLDLLSPPVHERFDIVSGIRRGLAMDHAVAVGAHRN